MHTTLQPALQRLAERAVNDGAAELEERHPKARGAQVALVAVRVSDGAVVAMVGGRDYGESQFNRAVSGERQIGSTVKPLTYLFAFEDDPLLSPATLVDDSPIERRIDGKTWAPANYDGTWAGEITLREALARSRNVPAVLVAEQVGMGALEQDWKGLGLDGATDLPSASLGAFSATPLQLAGAYTVFPGGGVWARPRVVVGASDADGEVLWADNALTARKTSARAAWLATSMLEEVIHSGTGRGAARYGVTEGVGGKTGTTDHYRDAWFAGFSDELAVAVWVGFDKRRDLGLTGGQAALPIWARFMRDSGTVGGGLRAPAGVEEATLCAESHAPAGPGCEETYSEWFSEGRVPDDGCPVHGGPLDNAGDAVGRAWEGIKEALGGQKDSRRRLFGRKKRKRDLAPVSPE